MKSTEFNFPYGESFLKARIPTGNIEFVLEKAEHPGIGDEVGAIERCLREPTGCPPLLDNIRSSDRVAVLVTDNTRACPDDRLLPPILRELEKKVDRDNITIIIALGMHPPLGREAVIKKVGRDIVENYRVVNHDIDDTIYIGTTARGTPVEINRRVIEADYRISTGLIEPHLFAGFSGGRKSIAPGVFSLRSAYHNHGYKMIEHPLVRAGVLEGNPVHLDMVEQARMAKLNFIVNVLLNKRGEITHVVAGELEKAHEKGCSIEMKTVGVKVDREVDITVTTNNGAPLDLDLYQSCKGMVNASPITRQGGIIIIAASCFDGIGPDVFREVHMSADSPEAVLQMIKDKEPMGVQWQNQILARVQLKNDIYVVSDLEDSPVRDMMMTPFPTIEDALERAFDVLGRDARLAVVPGGPSVLPIIDE